MTGVNPAKHGIFGFADRIPNTYDIYYPNFTHIKSRPVWDILREYNKRSVVINLPSTYPAPEMHGILVAGFVATDLTRATFPASLVPTLKDMGYKIDVDTQLIHESGNRLLEDLFLTVEKRTHAILHFMKNEDYSLFIGVLTETDRLHHFFWKSFGENNEECNPLFLDYYKAIDTFLGKVMETIDVDTTLIILSDHGFCTLEQEVYINHWLQEEGYLYFETIPPKSIHNLGRETKAYCMDPGRIYINLKGREPNGSITPGNDYEQLRTVLISKLMEIKDPITGIPVIDKAYKREEIYHGKYLDRAPDIVIEPRHGYDLKGAVYHKTLFDKGIFRGMHTYDDAFVYINNKNICKQPLEIIDVTATLLASLDIPVPHEMDGSNFVIWN